MPISLSDGRLALMTVLVDRSTGTEHVLFEREGRYCHFAQEFVHGGYVIYLRVDWRDLENGAPTLDADIYRNDRGKRGKRIQNCQWHHTKLTAKNPEDVQTYAFTFQDLQLELIARRSMAVTFSLDAYIVAEPGNQSDDPT